VDRRFRGSSSSLRLRLFVAAGLSITPGEKNLIGFGLAFFVFVFMWNAFAAT
jgi:hypothetical protein